MTYHYFLGANGGAGFQSVYEPFLAPDRNYDILILKGGPGAGKSSFMKYIGKKAEEAGEEVEYIWCSGDPDSLDAVRLPRVGVIAVDGTNPHGTAPLGHPTKKVSICKILRGRLLKGTSTRRGFLGQLQGTSNQKQGVAAQQKINPF